MPDPEKPGGLYCPECRGVRLTVVGSCTLYPGVRIRYRECTVCGCRIKTKETTVHVTRRPTRKRP